MAPSPSKEHADAWRDVMDEAGSRNDLRQLRQRFTLDATGPRGGAGRCTFTTTACLNDFETSLDIRLKSLAM